MKQHEVYLRLKEVQATLVKTKDWYAGLDKLTDVLHDLLNNKIEGEVYDQYKFLI